MSTITSQQFEGTSIEEALAAAVDVLGDDLEIVDAQKVRRRRVLGVGRRERFEVTATKRSLAEPRDFEEVLKRMVDRVDDAERATPPPPVSVDRDWWRAADFVVPDQEVSADGTNGSGPAEDSAFEVDVRYEPARASRVVPVDRGSGDIRLEPEARPVVEPPAPASPVVECSAETPDWSHDALLELDLPSALVARIKPAASDDLAWVAATSTAIGELLATADAISGPCELTGHGAESAVHLIRGACDGFRLDSLIIDGRRVRATPLELSLAVRSLLRTMS